MSTYRLAENLSRMTGVPLYTVQLAALEGGYGLTGYGYLMEMGLGKTRTCLVEFWGLALEDRVDVLFLIAPKSLLGAWEEEAKEIGFPFPLHRMGKTPKQDAAIIKEITKAKRPCVVLVNYELITATGRGLAMMKALMAVKKRLYVPLDESIRIKSHDSIVGKLLYNTLTKVAATGGHFMRILSGRPAPQGPHDLWSQFRYIGLDIGTYFGFRNTYCKMGGYMGKKVVGAQNLNLLREKTGHRVFRAKKIDWTDLPTKLPAVTREGEMLPEQRHAYLSMMHEMVLEWGERTITVEMAVTAKQKLAQISTGFMYDNDGNTVWLMPFEKNPKLNDLRQFVEELDSKLIIPYHHRPALEALRHFGDEQMAKNEYSYAVLESGMSPDDIEFQKALFNKDPNCRYMFLQSSAHKYGHTLLGIQGGDNPVPCHTMYFFENTYNLDTRLQTEDRNHRHGQKYPCSIYDVAMSREDRETIKALQKKERLEEALLREITGVGRADA